MSIEFCRGPNVYLRETMPSDLQAIEDALSDWETFPLSTERVKVYLRGLFSSYKYIEKPYTDTSEFRELLSICRVSDDEVVGLTQFTILTGRRAETMLMAIRPSFRQMGYREEASLLRDAILFDELGIVYKTLYLIDSRLSPRGYQKALSTSISERTGLSTTLYETTKADWLSWKETNAATIPSYTYTGNGYLPPHLR